MKSIPLIIISATLSSCVVGPDYKKPSTTDLPTAFDKIPKGWKTASPADHLNRGDWWKRLGDPKLNTWMTRSQAASPTVESALARLNQARAITHASRIALQPKLDFNPRAESNRDSTNAFRASQVNSQQGRTNNTFNLPFDLSWEIDLWGRVRREQEAALADEQSAHASYQGVLLSLQADLAQNWFALRSTDSEIDLVRETLDLRKETQNLLTNRLQEGIGDDLDLSRSDAELASTEADLAALQRRRAELVSGIALIVGRPAQGFNLPHYPLTKNPPSIPISLPSTLLERRPDIAQAERNLASASARIGVSKAALFPKISLDASLGLASREAGNLLKTSSKAWSYGIDANIPLLRRTILKADLTRSQARYDELLADYRQTVLTSLREVDTALSSLKWLSRQQKAVSRQVKASKKAADLSKTRYLEGLTSLLEFIDAERTRLQASRAKIQLRNERHSATIQLIKALGGSLKSPTK